MFTVQYWNASKAAWKGTGSGTFPSMEAALQEQRNLTRMCDGIVRFRIKQKVAA